MDNPPEVTANTILLIDDAPVLSDIYAEKLREKGYGVSVAPTIDAALSWLKQNGPPTFVLADRTLRGLNIEDGGLQQLKLECGEAHIVVYTNVKELGPLDERKLLSQGASRVLDKSKMDETIGDLRKLLRELDELLQLTRELRGLSKERGKLVASLTDADVGLTVIDKRFHSWFNSLPEHTLGKAAANHARACSGGTCQIGAPINDFTANPCWGCTAAEVFKKHRRVDRLFLSASPTSVHRWLMVRSEPIKLDDETIGAREAIREVPEGSLAGIADGHHRLLKIAQSLIHYGFGRVRIYRAESQNRLKIVAAAAFSDMPDAAVSQYFSDLPHGFLEFDITGEPKAQVAFDAGTGLFVPTGTADIELGPVAKLLGLKPPFLTVPIWGSDKSLRAWICLDFDGLHGDYYDAAVELYAKGETLGWIQQDYGEEIRKALEATEMDGELLGRLTIVNKAQMGVGSTTTVAGAMKALREGLASLCPNCNVVVRILRDRTLQKEDRLSIGDSAYGDPIEVSDPRSLAVAALSRRGAIYISDYQQHRLTAKGSGLPEGYPVEYIKSTAQIPLFVEQERCGSLSIDSRDAIRWTEKGYNKPIEDIAKSVALILHDIITEERFQAAERDRAAAIAYAALSTGVSWHTWVYRHLFLIEARCNSTAAMLQSGNWVPEDFAAALSGLQDLVGEVRSGPPPEATRRDYCSLATVVESIKSGLKQSGPRVEFASAENGYLLAITEGNLRYILVAIISAFDGVDAAISIAEIPDMPDIRITITAADILLERIATIRETFRGVVKRKGRKDVPLLVARGIALASDGDLTEDNTGGQGITFRLVLPAVGSREGNR